MSEMNSDKDIKSVDNKNDAATKINKKGKKKFLKEFLFQKVRLNEFAKNEKLDSDYQYGVFLHLATDFMFFNDLLDSNYIENSTHDDFTQDLYYSYNLTNSYLEEKYN